MVNISTRLVTILLGDIRKGVRSDRAPFGNVRFRIELEKFKKNKILYFFDSEWSGKCILVLFMSCVCIFWSSNEFSTGRWLTLRHPGYLLVSNFVQIFLKDKRKPRKIKSGKTEVFHVILDGLNCLSSIVKTRDGQLEIPLTGFFYLACNTFSNYFKQYYEFLQF